MQRHGVEDHRPQLAHIAGKMIVRQQGEQFIRWLGRGLADRSRRFVEKVLQQQRDVLLVLAQRRYFDLMYRQAEEEIRAELVLTHHLRQVAVGRANDPRITGACDIGTQRVVHVLLQQAQQLHLRGHRQIADLVEKQRAAGSLGNQAGARLVGAGEGTLPVTEQRVGKERVVEAGDIDLDELSAQTAQFV